MAARRSSPRGRVSDGSTAKSGGLEGARVDGQSRGEGRVLVRSIEEENGGDKKGGAAAPGRPFCTGAWSWGMAQQGGATRQARAEREREVSHPDRQAAPCSAMARSRRARAARRGHAACPV
jgi:hypothetical protein